MNMRLPILITCLLASLLLAKISCIARATAARQLFVERVMDMSAGSHLSVDFSVNGYGD